MESLVEGQGEEAPEDAEERQDDEMEEGGQAPQITNKESGENEHAGGIGERNKSAQPETGGEKGH